jgi:hypothetical protein
VGPQIVSTDSLLGFLAGKVTGVVCDHTLSQYGNYSQISGAECVAALVRGKTPAVLITSFPVDDDPVLKSFNGDIPCLLDKQDAYDPLLLRNALERCRLEISGSPSLQRKPHRTLIRIEGLGTADGIDVIEAILPQWSNKILVHFPVSLLPTGLPEKLKSGLHLIANVNIGAEKARELFFKDFSLAPEPGSDAYLS